MKTAINSLLPSNPVDQCPAIENNNGEDTQKLDEVVVTALGIKRSEKHLAIMCRKLTMML